MTRTRITEAAYLRLDDARRRHRLTIAEIVRRACRWQQSSGYWGDRPAGSATVIIETTDAEWIGNLSSLIMAYLDAKDNGGTAPARHQITTNADGSITLIG